MTKFEKAQAQLDSIFLSVSTTTVAHLRDALIKNWSEETWTPQWVSSFLQTQNLICEDAGRYLIYYAFKQLKLNNLQDYCTHATSASIPITKELLKKYAYADDFTFSKESFNELFSQLNLQHTGQYTGDNKKIWAIVPTGKHLSKNKGTLVAIKDMPKPYLRNAIAKYVADNGQPDMHYILGQEKSEFYKLLQAFFTFELRNSI